VNDAARVGEADGLRHPQHRGDELEPLAQRPGATAALGQRAAGDALHDVEGHAALVDALLVHAGDARVLEVAGDERLVAKALRRRGVRRAQHFLHRHHAVELAVDGLHHPAHAAAAQLAAGPVAGRGRGGQGRRRLSDVGVCRCSVGAELVGVKVSFMAANSTTGAPSSL